MPLVRISMAKGKSPEYIAAVSESIYGALREQFVLAEGDLFHIFEQLDAGAFIYDRDYVSPEPRTDDFMIIQIVSDARRKIEKTATLQAICDRLGASPGVKPQDVTVILSTNSTLEDFSLGYGVSAAAPATLTRIHQESKNIMATNEDIVRKAYATAEIKDVAGFTALFTEDGIVRDMSTGAEYRGQGVRGIIDVYARAFPDMHRELYHLHNADDTVVVELSLNGTHRGPLELPMGTIPATGKEMHAQCCDVWRIEGGKIAVFDCYTAATVILGQLGVLKIGEPAPA